MTKDPPPSPAVYMVIRRTVDEELVTELREHRDEFTATLPASAVPNRPSIALISYAGKKLDAAGVMLPRHRVATRRQLVTVRHVTSITATQHHHLIRRLPTRNRSSTSETLKLDEAGTLTDASWRELRKVLIEDEDNADVIRGLESRLTQGPVNAPEATVLREERDAASIALRIAGVHPRRLLGFDERLPPGHFLADAPSAIFREDQLIQHDAERFADWEQVGLDSPPAAYLFSDGQNEVVVMNVHRTPTEETTGVDLLYHHLELNAFVLVQYKRLRDENGSLVYRPSSDPRYPKELERMEAVDALCNPDGTVDGYRLDYGPCFFKLCKPGGYVPGTTELIQGMYLPLEYWKRLLADPRTTGPRGGKVLSYDTVGRFMNNTAFTTMVERAWVGSSGAASDHINTILKEAVDRGRAVVFAVGSHRDADEESA